MPWQLATGYWPLIFWGLGLIYKLLRFSKNMNKDRLRLKLYLAIFSALLIIGILGFMVIENLSLVDAIYFAIVTMATVGYGDIHPQSSIGKILALILIVGGVGTFLGIVASITDLFLSRREDSFRLKKLNMVTGLFFSELGTDLLKRITKMDPGIDTLLSHMKVSADWTNDDFRKVKKELGKYHYSVDLQGTDLTALRDYLQKSATFLLRMLENPTLQERGNFTELLRAIFHFRDELLNRTILKELPDTDRLHLEGDIVRIYRLLVSEWLSYMLYLNKNYSYLFSLAMRINPFDPQADAVVK